MDPYNHFPPSMGPDGGPPLLEATQCYGVDQFGNALPTYTEEIVYNFRDILSGHDWGNDGP